MKKHFILILIVVLLVLSSPLTIQGKENTRGKFGVGFQRVTWNSWGLSGMVDLTRTIAIEGLAGVAGDDQAYAVRGLFRFFNRRNYNIYGYGALGMLTIEEIGRVSGLSLIYVEETGLVLGTGIGGEYDTGKIAAGFFSVSLCVEIGFENISQFEVIDGNYSSMTYSAGFHIRF